MRTHVSDMWRALKHIGRHAPPLLPRIRRMHLNVLPVDDIVLLGVQIQPLRAAVRQRRVVDGPRAELGRACRPDQPPESVQAAQEEGRQGLRDD
jgi:hypothetical protein